MTSLFYEYFVSYMFPSKYKDFYDPVRDDFNSKTKLHKYSCYYP